MFADISQTRFQHTHILGGSGMGKSTCVKSLVLDDIHNNEGLLYIDPHGEDIDDILLHIPTHRRDDVILFDPSDEQFPIGFNPFLNVAPRNRPLVANHISTAFRSLWDYSSPTPTMSQYLVATTRALLDTPNTSIMGIQYMLTSPRYREQILNHVSDPVIRSFWEDTYNQMTAKEQRDESRSTLNKVFALISDPRVRNILSQHQSIDLHSIMAERKILLARLPQGKLGIDQVALFGSLLLAQVHIAALSNKTPFHVFVDECHHFAARTQAEMLSGIRKFHVSLTLVHQYLAQVPEELQDALIGTVGTRVGFRMGVEDSEYLQDVFRLGDMELQLHSLYPHQAYVATPYGTHKATVAPVLTTPLPRMRKYVKNRSRAKYGTDRRRVEKGVEAFIASVSGTDRHRATCSSRGRDNASTVKAKR